MYENSEFGLHSVHSFNIKAPTKRYMMDGYQLVDNRDKWMQKYGSHACLTPLIDLAILLTIVQLNVKSTWEIALSGLINNYFHKTFKYDLI